MNTPKFTPGQWNVMKAGNTSAGIIAGTFELATAHVRDWNPASQGERDANARLIAAAPEMYEALHGIYRCNHYDHKNGVYHITPAQMTVLGALLAKIDGAA